MGDFDGRVSDFGWRLQQLRTCPGREPGHSGRYLCSRMPAPSRAAHLRDHAFAGKDLEGSRFLQAHTESGIAFRPGLALPPPALIHSSSHQEMARRRASSNRARDATVLRTARIRCADESPKQKSLQSSKPPDVIRRLFILALLVISIERGNHEITCLPHAIPGMS